jgi:hypothetical protein
MDIKQKQYGSFKSALDHIDDVLARHKLPSLLEHFNTSVNYRDDLSNIFDDGVQ